MVISSYFSILLLSILFISSGVLSVSPYNFNKPTHIIIGGGGAGSQAAADFSSNPNFTVVVLEQGPSDIPQFSSAIGAASDVSNPYSRMWLPISQSFCALARSPPFVSITANGGSTLAYGAVNTRPSAPIANLYPPGYQFNDLMQEWIAMEDHACYYLDPSVTGISASECQQYHGKGGPIPISGQPYGAISSVMEAMVDSIGASFIGSTPDYNGANQLGAGFEWNFKSAENPADPLSPKTKATGKSIWLTPSVLARPNLKILNFARVKQILIGNINKTAYGVIYEVNGTGEFPLYASIRVHVASGVIGSPQLLQVSGVSSAAVSGALGTTLRVNNPYVGQKLHAHQGVFIAYQTNETMFSNSTLSSANAVEIFFNTGTSLPLPDGNNVIRNVQIEVLNGVAVMSADTFATGLPVQQTYSFLNGLVPSPYFTYEIESTYPQATGSVTATTRDIHLPPRLDWGWTFEAFISSTAMDKIRKIVKERRGNHNSPYISQFKGIPDMVQFVAQLQELDDMLNGRKENRLGAGPTSDLLTLISAIAIARSTTQPPNAFADWVVQEVYPANYFSDILANDFGLTGPTLAFQADLFFIMYDMFNFYHLTGSCSMGTCVDSNGNVNGARRLSVCDNSILPVNPDANPTFTMWAYCRIVNRRLMAIDAALFPPSPPSPPTRPPCPPPPTCPRGVNCPPPVEC